MLPSSRRISKVLFDSLLKKGRSFHSASFSARIFFTDTGGKSRFSVVVAKKLEKSAVSRNKIKRQVYAILRNFLKKTKDGVLVALFMKKKVSRSELKMLSSEIEIILKKAGAV